MRLSATRLRVTNSNGSRSFDGSASAYIAAVEAADGQSLEAGVKTAINTFVVGCKADGIWDAIKASCILAGARTLSGALVPLAGTAPTNVGPFVSGDYNWKTGLVGNGSTKYLNSNRNNNTDPQNNFHMSCYVSTAGGATAVYMGVGPTTDETGASNFGRSSPGIFARNRFGAGTSADVPATVVSATGLIGTSRNVSASATNRVAGTNSTSLIASQLPNNNLIAVYASTSGVAPTNARLAFYSIGESLDLALLDARVSALITAFGAAIP